MGTVRVHLQLLFVLYILLVSILLMNMLIAMMTQTFTIVNETKKEYLRQVMKAKSSVSSLSV